MTETDEFIDDEEAEEEETNREPQGPPVSQLMATASTAKIDDRSDNERLLN